jgi:hypothetical protein
MLHKCHETFQQLGAINYHNLISDLCRKLRISASDRDGRRGGGGPTRGRGGRHATSEPDGQNSTVVRPDSPTTKASDESFRRRLGTKAWVGARDCDLCCPRRPESRAKVPRAPCGDHGAGVSLRGAIGRRKTREAIQGTRGALRSPGIASAVARPEGRPSRDAL